MNDTTKSAILAAIERHGVVDNPLDIVTEVGLGAGVHNIVHQLWRLQKQGLVKFRERKSGKAVILTRVQLTDRGRAWLAENR